MSIDGNGCFLEELEEPLEEAEDDREQPSLQALVGEA